MSVELASTPETGDVLASSHARIVPLAAGPQSYAAAVDRYLAAAGISKGSARIYRISLTNWAWLLAGEPTPLGPSRRGATAPAVTLILLARSRHASVRSLERYARPGVDSVAGHVGSRDPAARRKTL